MSDPLVDDERLVEWHRWLDERPEAVRRVAVKVPPWKLYDEMDDGTVTLRAREPGGAFDFIGIDPSSVTGF